MNATVQVVRMQYGIGQGGFHAQQIGVQPVADGVVIEPYRFVYDCGADTAPVRKGQPRPLDWAICHFAENDNPARADKLRVDSLYLSHFQKDHIDGARLLAELVDLREIVIPHLSPAQLAQLITQQIFTGSVAALTPEVQEYLAVLARAAGDGPIIGDIPTTRVQGGGEPPSPNARGVSRPEPPRRSNGEPRNEEENLVDALKWDEFLDRALPAGGYRVSHSVRTGPLWSHHGSRLLQVQSVTGGVSVTNNFWELRVWSYAQASALTDAVIDKLSSLEKAPGQKALPRLLQGQVDLNEIWWAIKHRTTLQQAYEAALTSQGVKHASDHNVVSLCLHSGPTTLMTYERSRSYWRDVGTKRCELLHGNASSWLGTGDALLSDSAVWADFSAHFTGGGVDLTQTWLTVLMPHHGSGAGGNFNPSLLSQPVQFAVFSAGAFNKYHHPSRGVLEAVADSSASAVIVTEFSRPGFFESLTYSLRPAAWGSW